jgi:hypothetical protein
LASRCSPRSTRPWARSRSQITTSACTAARQCDHEQVLKDTWREDPHRREYMVKQKEKGSR